MAHNSPAFPEGSGSIEARGDRVRHIRETLLRFSRREFSKGHAVPAATLQNWESGKYGGLTEKGALKLVNAFQSEGVPCSVEWLLYGIGAEPTRTNLPIFNKNLDLGQVMAQEVGLFRQLHPNSVDAIVSDDSMEPGFYAGDLVAGERYFAEEITKAVGRYCILQLIEGEVLIRELRPGKKKDEFILACINTKAKIKTKVIKANSLFSAAPIVWIRRRA